MDDTLLLLGDLRQALSESGGMELRQRWWDLVLLIETALNRDHECSDVDHYNLTRLHSGVRDVIVAHRDDDNPIFNLATAPLTALENSIRKRTRQRGLASRLKVIAN
jgi:hypothetical protein